MLHDATEFSYQREKPEVIGITKSINCGRDKAGRPRSYTACGILMHSSLAMTVEGLPLGLPAVKFWTRKKFKGTAALKTKIDLARVPIEKKESIRWLDNQGQSSELLGEDTSEMLEYVPASFRVVRHIRPKLACSRCDRIVQVAAPSRPIAQGLAGPGLLAHVLVAKYADHLPLYRQSEIGAREGMNLERSTLADWVGGASALLRPLVEALARETLGADKLHTDDTTVPVLAPGHGRTRTGRLWVYVRDDRPAGDGAPPAVLFRYSADRKGERPQDHLKDFRGFLQADAYAGYNKLYGIEVACWAHARRKFHDVYVDKGSGLAREALDRIGALYDVEAAIRGHAPADRRDVRQARAGLVLEPSARQIRPCGSHPLCSLALGPALPLSR